MTRHRIPVRVGPNTVSTRTVYPEQTESKQVQQEPLPVEARRRTPEPRSRPATGVSAPAHAESKEGQEQADWRERALRLQAEMDNYRKRQRRIAQEEAQAEQERLLHDILRVADNLDRTLAAGQGRPGASNGLREGVELTRDDLLNVLAKYGIERFDALGEPFDPEWHEAVHVVPARALGVQPGTVVEQVQPGYRKHAAEHGDRLFRPAQVVVAN